MGSLHLQSLLQVPGQPELKSESLSLQGKQIRGSVIESRTSRMQNDLWADQ